MIYKVATYSQIENSTGLRYFSNKKDAERYAKENTRDCSVEDWDTNGDQYWAEITPMPTPKTKQEMISLLNIHGGHNDNG